MEASRELIEQSYAEANAVRVAPWQDSEQQVAHLESLYASWQEDIYGKGEVHITELIPSLSRGESQDELLRQMSGYIALIALDSSSSRPLHAYNVAQIAVLNHAAAMEADTSMTDDELTGVLIDQAILASNKVSEEEPVQESFDQHGLALLQSDEIVEKPELTVVQQPNDEEVQDRLPALADARSAETFTVGQSVLILADGRLERATITKAEAYQSSTTLGPPLELSAEEIRVRQQLLEQRQLELIDKPDYYPGVAPDSEVLRLKIALCNEFQQVVQNPSPGLLRLAWQDGQKNLITDMHHNYIITDEEWEVIKSSETYREVWLKSGSRESQRLSPVLADAIKVRILEGK